jgi:hypothetical protein
MWYSLNPAHQTQEPHMGIVHQGDAQLDLYANITPPVAVNDVYLWLNADETVFANGKQYRFSPCRVFGWETAKIPLKQNVVYRIRARYNTQGLEGPRVVGSPMGFAIKEGGWLWPNNETGRCYYPGTGTVLAATYNTTGNEPWTNYPDPQHPGWRILEGTFNSGSKDFLNYLYLAIENTVSTDGDNASGHVFVDEVSIQENLGSGAFGPNVIYKGSMAHHTYINQRNAYAFDKVLDLARQYDIYLKPVMNEKNDYVFLIFNFDGTMPATKNPNLFYGNGTESAGASKVRWLQESWWRYMQARWGYSQNIHSWELLNEGPPETRHFILADEFAKYMKCDVFGVPAGGDCTYVHPNQHMVTTSFWSGFPWNFWRNTLGSYPDLDYADIHDYLDTSAETGYYDAALFTQTASKLFGANEPGGALKPVIRGETGWRTFSGTDLFAANASNGLWLHNLIWGGINSSGLIEHYWVGSPTQDHIYKAGSHDHRPMFKAYSNFIKDIPLNNGNYVDAAATAGVTALRAWGQKDTVNGRVHLWIQNSAHTWKNIYDGVAISPITTTVTIPGFAPNTNYAVEWRNTSTGFPTNSETRTSDNGGNLVLQVTNLTTDIAVRIGDYKTSQPPTNLRLVIK